MYENDLFTHKKRVKQQMTDYYITAPTKMQNMTDKFPHLHHSIMTDLNKYSQHFDSTISFVVTPNTWINTVTQRLRS